MVKAEFPILKAENSLQLIMFNYGFLIEIDKCFSRVYISELSGNGSCELVVISEAWLQFVVSLHVDRDAIRQNSCELFDSSGCYEFIKTSLADFINYASCNYAAILFGLGFNKQMQVKKTREFSNNDDLICCKSCPSAFHQSCVDMKVFSYSNWNYVYCTCKCFLLVDISCNGKEVGLVGK